MDITILKNMASSTGRETFITDDSFNILWTNSEKDLVELLLQNSSKTLNSKPETETLVRCGDDSMRILPITDGSETVFLFEFISASHAAELFAKTSALNALKDRLDESMKEYNRLVNEAVMTAPYLYNKLGSQRVRDSNVAALLEILTVNDNELLLDVSEHIKTVLNELVGSRYSAKLIRFDQQIKNGIFCFVDRNDVDYAIMNMISNAVKHCKPKDLPVVHFKVSADDSFCIIEVWDNGTDADLERIRSHMKLCPDKDSGFSGLGLAIISTFAEKYGGTAECSLTETGGLHLTVKIKRPKNKNMISLYSPETDDPFSDTINFMRSGFQDILDAYQ